MRKIGNFWRKPSSNIVTHRSRDCRASYKVWKALNSKKEKMRLIYWRKCSNCWILSIKAKPCISSMAISPCWRLFSTPSRTPTKMWRFRYWAQQTKTTPESRINQSTLEHWSWLNLSKSKRIWKFVKIWWERYLPSSEEKIYRPKGFLSKLKVSSSLWDFSIKNNPLG